MRFVSIIGDSISTFEGLNPEGYDVFYDREMQQENGLTTADDTWWGRVIRALDADLCVNNAWSGSRVTGFGPSAASSGMRTGALHTRDHKPDMVLIYIGCNDFANGVPLESGRKALFFKKDRRYFESAYAAMLSGIKRRYPNAVIVCSTLMRSCVAGYDRWKFPECYGGIEFEKYNQAIRKVCRQENCVLADVAALNMRYETLDGWHPTLEGHELIAHAWLQCLSGSGIL